ncbi:zinc ion binding nucleic acid binding [Euphorbia peplus]|nr:zinc ion binding nucleic acid binding [Euphorbia peplus]
MDDSCAVCAETLEWVAYGPCGHREVCSTCIIRLRFICNDRCCCICKSESTSIFVTKALGDYTRTINDFSGLPTNPIEGQVGQYWFHEGAQAYFDDADHFKIIKAMCRLSCNVCEKKNGPRNGESKRSADFSNIEQLKIHLFHQHKLFMCSLCLEGRKIFISEQKLYNRAQLSQHVKTGDSVVDGSESERGGFTGHPMCEFCQNPFYGDNELYLHMSTEHFTCHICQRQHPGKYEYHDDYDDLETHFRQQHFLCEDEACLAKKFIVFVSESEMKRHVAIEHKGRLSRSKRNAALQIPISFQYQQPSEQDRRGRRHRFGSNSSDFQLSMAIQESLETSNTSRSCNVRSTTQTSTSVNTYELLAGTDSEPSSRSVRISGQNSTSTSTMLEESSFPPLPMAPKRGSKTAAGRLSGNTLADRLRNHNSVKVLNSSRASAASSSRNTSSVSISLQSRPVSGSGHLPSSSSASSSVIYPINNNEYSLSSHASSRSSAANDRVLPLNLASSSRIQTSTSRLGHFPSAPNPEHTVDKSISNSRTMSSQPVSKVEDVGSANKVLVEKIRAALNFDDDKFAAFKLLSVEYRKDLIGTAEYLAYVYQFGLEHLVLELAILCPDAQKQRELVEIYNTRNTCSGSSLTINNGGLGSRDSSKKGKEKYECNHSSEKAPAESFNRKVMNLQLNHRSLVKEAKGLDKAACHSAKGKSKVEEVDPILSLELRNGDDAQSATLKKNVVPGGGGNKPRKKVPKFVRNRIGDTSATAHEESSNVYAGLDDKEKSHWKKDPPEVLPVHGVWRNGGGRRLVVLTERDRRK